MNTLGRGFRTLQSHLRSGPQKLGLSTGPLTPVAIGPKKPSRSET